MTVGYVYLLLSVSIDNIEKHKIGVTTRNIDKRIAEHQTGNPNKISLLKFYKTVNYFKVEKWLHRKYSS